VQQSMLERDGVRVTDSDKHRHGHQERDQKPHPGGKLARDSAPVKSCKERADCK